MAVALVCGSACALVSNLLALARKQPLGMRGGSRLIILVCLAVSAPLLMPLDPYQPSMR